jgi:spore coat protein CotH
MVEEPDDSLLKSQFSNDNGNLYKPDGAGARFTEGSFSTEYFIKQSNEMESNWSDVESVFEALHSSNRTSNPELWRSDLQEVFHVDGFLNYLAVNTVIQNWDTYGRMTHNYYLYGNPENNNALTWIPWDNNESLQLGKMGGSLPLDFNGVQDNWPLITYLYADSEYRIIYDNYVSSVINNAFETGYIQSIYSYYSSMIEASVLSEQSGYTFLESPTDFQIAISELMSHAQERASAVNQYLN